MIGMLHQQEGMICLVFAHDNITKVRGEKMDSQLAPCRVCLKEINYEGYENSGKQARDEIVAHFSTEEFFEHNHHIFRCLPLYT